MPDEIKAWPFVGVPSGAGEPSGMASVLMEGAAARGDALRDNWSHRSDLMRCQTCIWFVPKGAALTSCALGRCRRRAPTHNGFPAVFPTDWCGDHKLDEEKVR